MLYDAWHKGNALSPVLMARCRALVYVVAGLAVADALNPELWGAAALLFVYVVGLTQVAKAEGGGLAARWPVLAVLAPAAYWAKELPDAGGRAAARGVRRVGRARAVARAGAAPDRRRRRAA